MSESANSCPLQSMSCTAVAGPADEAAQKLALETLIEACVIASAVSKELNYLDLAYLLLSEPKKCFTLLGDPVKGQSRLHVAAHPATSRLMGSEPCCGRTGGQ